MHLLLCYIQDRDQSKIQVFYQSGKRFGRHEQALMSSIFSHSDELNVVLRQPDLRK